MKTTDDTPGTYRYEWNKKYSHLEDIKNTITFIDSTQRELMKQSENMPSAYDTELDEMETDIICVCEAKHNLQKYYNRIAKRLNRSVENAVSYFGQTYPEWYPLKDTFVP